jgi:hypothetical protein
MDPVSSPESPTRPHFARPPDEPAQGGAEDDGDRISVTDVNGTVARFEMAYSPPKKQRVTFGPPLSQRLPSLLFIALAVAMVAVVTIAKGGSSDSRLYAFVVLGDRGRPLSAQTLSYIVLLSAIGTAIRARMRGVVVMNDGIEARYLLAIGFPRIRRWAWSQIERMIVDESQVMLELWNGQYERLPPVADPAKLSNLLEHISATRQIRLTRLKSTR